eukprot:scaffold75540_cov22-Tisochrysis_lutea.AAC.1
MSAPGRPVGRGVVVEGISAQVSRELYEAQLGCIKGGMPMQPVHCVELYPMPNFMQENAMSHCPDSVCDGLCSHQRTRMQVQEPWTRFGRSFSSSPQSQTTVFASIWAIMGEWMPAAIWAIAWATVFASLLEKVWANIFVAM